MDTGGRDTWGTERQRQQGTDPEGSLQRPRREDRQTGRQQGPREREDRRLDRGTPRQGGPVGRVFQPCPSPTQPGGQTCRPHVAGFAARIHEVQVPVGVCGLLGSVLITAPLRNHGCPKGILHGHGRVVVPRVPTLAQGPSGDMRVEHEPWVSPLTPTCTKVHIPSTPTLHPKESVYHKPGTGFDCLEEKLRQRLLRGPYGQASSQISRTGRLACRIRRLRIADSQAPKDGIHYEKEVLKNDSAKKKKKAGRGGTHL